ncbi:Pentatricopeptide repeat [Cinnamomum micranthum f. kanehirae]|uniref:Pentatricopeptide repeat n=1 Tax=Cinnamomum micranthum f. kanehirae TaxID=337451 RepID=A0A443NNG2_9MAGN|nr:Pentatricopeptide repeat [Cinnamomum micranthum f. kanehirae]
MYARCGQVNDLEQVFSEMPKMMLFHGTHLGQNGMLEKALEVAKKALKLEAFNHNTFIAILTSCSHGGMICLKSRRITDAHNVFPEMTFGPNSVAWMTLLSACFGTWECTSG